MKQLHQHLKPHHHVSIWTIAVLSLIYAAVSYNGAYIALAIDRGPGSPGDRPAGPSAATKSFFGDEEGSPGDEGIPAACQQEQREGSPGPTETTGGALGQEEERLRAEMTALQQQMSSTSPEQQGELRSKMEELGRKMQEAGRARQDNSQRSENDGQLVGGPSAACQEAIVAQQQASLMQFSGKIENNILPTLDKVDQLVAKVSVYVPNLTAVGVSAEVVAQIEADISTIKQSSATMREFFTLMRTQLKSFLAKAGSDPSTAFKEMESSFGDGGRQQQAAAAGDSLVTAFERLEKNIASIQKPQS